MILLSACWLLLQAPASAITISIAKIDKGAVQVKGSKATPLSLITWEGHIVAQAANNGKFRFATTVLPNDCVGTLSDGADPTEVVIKFCGPPGPPGPQGLPGPACQPQACATPIAIETPSPGAVTVRFNFNAIEAIQAFQVRTSYSPSAGGFVGNAENVDCTVTGGGGIFTKSDNDFANQLTLSVANSANLSFPIAVDCAFNTKRTVHTADFGVTVQEVTQNNATGDVNDLAVTVTIISTAAL